MEAELRKELTGLLKNGWAYENQEDILADVSIEAANERAPHVPYSLWHLLEHINFCQREILEQIELDQMPAYTFPDDFWPNSEREATAADWENSVGRFFRDREQLIAIAQTADLRAGCRAKPEVSVLHALYNIAAHNHYHMGEFAILRQVLQNWPEDRE